MTISSSTKTNEIIIHTLVRTHTHTHFYLSFMSGITAECSLSVPPVLIDGVEVERGCDSHLDVLLQLDLMLARQLFVLPLELGDE